MKKLTTSTLLTAAALLAACGNDNSRYAQSDSSRESTYTASNDQSSMDGNEQVGPYARTCPMHDQTARASSDGDFYSSSAYERDASGRLYRTSDTARVPLDYVRGQPTGDPNRDYSSDAGYSIKAHEGSWYGSRDVESTDSYASSQDDRMDASRRDRARDRADMSSNEVYRTETYQSQPRSDRAASASSNTEPFVMVAAPSADARILSILNVKDQEEADIGRLAQSKGSSDEVREYGARLVKDHTAHAAEVRSVASSAGITLMDPHQVKALIAKEKGKPVSEMKDPVAELRSLSGAEFDRKFAAKMQAAHTKCISMVEQAQYDVKNLNVKELLARTLPTLRSHQQMASKLNSESTDSYASPNDR